LRRDGQARRRARHHLDVRGWRTGDGGVVPVDQLTELAMREYAFPVTGSATESSRLQGTSSSWRNCWTCCGVSPSARAAASSVLANGSCPLGSWLPQEVLTWLSRAASCSSPSCPQAGMAPLY